MNGSNDLEKQINNLKLNIKGVELEYQYVTDLKNRKILELQDNIENEKEKKEYYKKEFEECVKKMENYKKELDIIKASRWWRFREKIISRKS